MDNEENINEGNIDNSTSDSPIEDTPTENTDTDSSNNSPKTTYGNKDNIHNNTARRSNEMYNKLRNASDRAKRRGENLNKIGDKLAKNHPKLGGLTNKAGNISNKYGNAIGGAADKLEGINNGIQGANNVANAVEDPLGTAKDAAVDKAKEKAGEVAKKATEKAKETTKKVVKKTVVTVITPLIPILLATIAIIFLVIIVVSIFMVLVGAASSNDSNTVAEGGNGECGFTLTATSLSRDEYISAIKNYSSKTTIASEFVTHAGTIYDRATAKGINPELVIIRAIAESGASRPSASYNYWGMGCSNTGGGSDCHSYSRFMDGVDEYIENISKYNSLTDMMSKYSYLGDYWYNPGDAGTGGCYYASFIYDTIPARVKTACSSGKTCNLDNKSGCTKTTDEEREQYTKWQVEKNMASIREKVFGLKPEEGVSCNSENNGTLEELTTYKEGHDGLKMLTSPLSSSQINQLNNYIKTSVDKSGYGTGAGVAAAGQSLIQGMRQFGYYLPYYWGGGNGDGAAKIGVSSFLGTSGTSCSDRSGICYHHHSFDCSGFVSWSIKNGCKSSFTAVTAATFNSDDFGKVINIKNAKPGDIMATNGHVILVVKNNGDGTVMTAHSTGSSNEGNIVFVKRNSSDSHKARDMSNWYKKNCDKSR